MVSNIAEWSKDIWTGFDNLIAAMVEKRKPDCGGLEVSGK